jgi:hypothetical protein
MGYLVLSPLFGEEDVNVFGTVSTFQASQVAQSFGSVVNFYRPGAGAGSWVRHSLKPMWHFRGDVVSIQLAQETLAFGGMRFIAAVQNKARRSRASGNGRVYNFQEEAMAALVLMA